METQQAVTDFLNFSRVKNLAPSTIRNYSNLLRYFVEAYPDGLPQDWPLIERFINKTVKKKEARVKFRKVLSSMYSLLESQGQGPSPIPKGKAGRPRKAQPPQTRLGGQESEPEKSVQGGGSLPQRIDLHIYLHSTSA